MAALSEVQLIAVALASTCAALLLLLLLLITLFHWQSARKQRQESQLPTPMLKKLPIAEARSEHASSGTGDSGLSGCPPAWTTGMLPPHLVSKTSSRPLRSLQIIPPEDLVSHGQIVGQGNFALVMQGELRRLDHGPCRLVVAIKRLRPNASRKACKDFLVEVELMSRLEHPHIVHAYGITAGQPPALVMELMSLGDLKSWLDHQRKERAVLSAKLMIDFCRQICE